MICLTIPPFHSHFVKMYEKQLFTDFQLKMNDGQVLKAHKSVLASRSSVFEQMLVTNMKESELSKIEIEDFDSEVMKHVLQWLYTDKVRNIDDVAGRLVYAAEKYELEELKKNCIKKLIQKLSVDNVMSAFKISEQITGAKPLRDSSIEFINE